MTIFFIALTLLITGYFTYGVLVEKVFGIDENRQTPAIEMADGVDYVAMPLWKIFFIQFLNIAGLGPVFGAILGALYGPVCLLWIVFGSILAGGVHDYLSGMVSVRSKGQAIVSVADQLFGKYFKIIFLIFYILLLLLLGTVFAINPAKMLADLTHSGLIYWTAIIFFYYFLATLLPIDKIIGKIYPYFAALLIIMTVSLSVALLLSGLNFYPDLTLSSLHPEKCPIFPMLFITVACGAISGFHATQSPIVARCLTNEKQGRIIFYGAMITEGIIALIWATLGIAFYQHTGGLLTVLNSLGQGGVISQVSTKLLGNVGGALTVLSIIVLSITSGDSAFRAIRITTMDFFNVDKGKFSNRLIFSTVILTTSVLISRTNMLTLWEYFGWSNQTLATFVLWILTYYLFKNKKCYFITLIPAVFMTSVCVSYICYDKIGFNLPINISNTIGIVFAILCLTMYFIKTRKAV